VFLFWERGCHLDSRVKLCNGALESPALWFTLSLILLARGYLNVLGRRGHGAKGACDGATVDA